MVIADEYGGDVITGAVSVLVWAFMMWVLKIKNPALCGSRAKKISWFLVSFALLFTRPNSGYCEKVRYNESASYCRNNTLRIHLMGVFATGH